MEEKTIFDAKQLLVVNKERQQKVVGLLKPGSKYEYLNSLIVLLTIDTFHKYSIHVLNEYIKVRILNNLTDVITLPIKGKPDDVQSGNLDCKTKGPFLTALEYNYRVLPNIGKVSELQVIEISP